MLGVDNATSEVVHHFLRSLTVKVSRTTVCRLLDSPLGNTMQGISDALNALHVNNVVYQLQPKYLEKLHGPFITQLETSHSTFCLVEKMTLSKILCKWKQDSVISFSLYLDSVFKYKHKLVHNQSPV